MGIMVGNKPLLDYFMAEGKNGNGNVFVNHAKDENLDLYTIKYMHMAIEWEKPYMLASRGLVINSDSEIVARPFDKFFNYQQFTIPRYEGDISVENSKFRDNEPFNTLEKVDGSLSIIYTYKDELFFSGSNYIDGVVADKNKRLYKELYGEDSYNVLKKLGTKFTVLMEVVDLNNQIVIKYDKPAFYLLAVRDTQTGQYVNYEGILKVAKRLGVSLPKKYDMKNVHDILDFMATLKGQEGVVINYADGYRLKFKTEDYIKLHLKYTKFRGGINTKNNIIALLDMVRNDTLDDLLAERHQKYNEDHNKKIDLMSKIVQDYWKVVTQTFEKEFAEIKSLEKPFFSPFLDYAKGKEGLNDVIARSLIKLRRVNENNFKRAKDYAKSNLYGFGSGIGNIQEVLDKGVLPEVDGITVKYVPITPTQRKNFEFALEILSDKEYMEHANKYDYYFNITIDRVLDTHQFRQYTIDTIKAEYNKQAEELFGKDEIVGDDVE